MKAARVRSRERLLIQPIHVMEEGGDRQVE